MIRLAAARRPVSTVGAAATRTQTSLWLREALDDSRFAHAKRAHDQGAPLLLVLVDHGVTV